MWLAVFKKQPRKKLHQPKTKISQQYRLFYRARIHTNTHTDRQTTALLIETLKQLCVCV